MTPYPAGDESVDNLVTLCIGCHEWLHYGFLDAKADRLREFRRWWRQRTAESSFYLK